MGAVAGVAVIPGRSRIPFACPKIALLALSHHRAIVRWLLLDVNWVSRRYLIVSGESSEPCWTHR